MEPRLRSLILVVIVSLVIIPFAPPAVEAKVTKLYEHTFAKSIDKSQAEWRAVNVTDTFDQDDEFVYAVTKASFGSTNFTWRWYAPGNVLYNTDTAKWGCSGVCTFYDRLSIRDRDAAGKFGFWRMDLIADGSPLYSDNFTLKPRIREELDWTFDIYKPMQAHVSMAVVIHPPQGKEWDSYVFTIGARASNYSAFENPTRIPLGISQTSKGSQTEVKVVFLSPKGDGYKFVVAFDLRSEFGTMGNDTFLRWQWYTDIHPRPESVTVILPKGYAPVQSLSTAAATGYENDRVKLTFQGSAPPNEAFRWIIVYSPLSLATSTTTASTMIGPSQPANPLALVVAVISVILIGAVAVFLLRRKKTGNS